MGAQGSQSGISFRLEAVWGSVDPGQFNGVNFVSEDMAFNIENQVSNNVRPDRQTVDLVQVGAETGGGFETEFQATNLDLLLPGFLYDDKVGGGWNTPPAGESVVFTIETGGGLGGIMTVADSSLYKIGQCFWILGSVSNNIFVRVKALPDGTHVQVVQPLVTESSVAVTFEGEYIRTGVAKRSFSIERANNDVSQFFLYTGMTPNTLEMTIEAGSPIMANLAFIGEDEALAQTTASTGAPTALPVTPILNAVSSVGEIAIDGAALSSCLLQKVDFTLDNQVAGKTGVAKLGFCDADAKYILMGGSISMYFNDETYYNRYLNSAAFSLSITLTDSLGNSYNLYLPECKFDSATANVTGKDDDVMVEGTFVAIMDPDALFTFQITRNLV